MALYDFHCPSCDQRFEARVPEAERPPCPRCGAGAAERVPSGFSGPFTVRPIGGDARRSDAARRERRERRRDRRQAG